MGVRELLGIGESAAARAEARAIAAENQVEVMSEAFADLQRAMEEPGWARLGELGDKEFTRQGLRNISRVARVQLVASPLIKRGMSIRCAYIWGGNLEISARGNGEQGGQDVNGVIQAYLDDPLNQANFTGDEAQERLERALGSDGNVFLANFTRPLTGAVQTRVIPFDEIEEIYTNPDDSGEPWYYLRVFNTTSFLGGVEVSQQQRVLYPALSYYPRTRPRRLTVMGHGEVEVRWDAPIRHVKVNDLQGWKYGIGDVYAALGFARMHKDFLTDWATLVKSLSQFAWQLTKSGDTKGANAIRQKLQRAGAPTPGNPGAVGGTLVSSEDIKLEAIPKTGATIDADSGQPLAAMVASALGVPVTMLLADPGTTGARAVAETLDVPTENEMGQRRTVWQTAYRDILNYVILQSVKAPQGELRGTIRRDPWADREVLELPEPEDAVIDFSWPPLRQQDVEKAVKAIAEAEGTGKMPPLVTLRLLLSVLGVEDVDDIVTEWTDAEGKWIDPNAETAAAVAAAAVDAFRRGQDPATAMGGDPDEDDEEDPEDEDGDNA